MPVFKERARSLRALLEGSVGFGDLEYLVCDELRLSFAQHARVVASVAKAFAERYGIGKGDRVAILAANCPEWIVSFWAALSLGAIAVGLNGWWAGDEIVYGLEDSDPKLLIGDRKRLARIAGRPLRMPVVEIEQDFEKLWSHDLGARASGRSDRRGRSRHDPVHERHHRPPEGRRQHAPQHHRALPRADVPRRAQLMLGAGQGGPPALSTGACMLMNTPLFHVSGLYAGAVTLLSTGVKTVWTTGRFDPVQVLAADRAREGHELGADGHHDPCAC